MRLSPEALHRYRRLIGHYRDRTALAVVTAWDQLGGHDEADFPKFVQVTAPPLAAGKNAAVALSAAFFSVVLNVPPVGVNPDEVTAVADVKGPFRATWHALSMGRGLDEAIQVGRSTAQSMSFDYVQSAARLTGDTVAQRSGVDGVRWMRVPGPNACDWCIEVARDDYLSAESADFGHERDDCDVVPSI